MNLLVGCAVAVVSGATQSLGFTLQRKSHLLDQSDELEPDYRHSHTSSIKLWRIGVVLFVAANVFGSSVQILALPLVVLCPLQATGIVFNSVFATLLLGEPFSRLSGVGTGLICIGAGLVAGMGAVPEPKRTLDELIFQFSRTGFEVWMLLTLVAAGVCVSYQRKLRSDMHKGLLFAVASGVMSAHSVLMAKSVVQLLVQIVHDPIPLLRISFWVILFSFITFAVLQLVLANEAIRCCSSSVVYPLTFCVFNLLSLGNSAIYYNGSDISPTHIFWIALGTVLLLAGVLCLSLRYESPAYVFQVPKAPSTPTDRSPLLGDDSHYTSLDSLDPSLSSPDTPKSVSFARRQRHAGRSLSKEQSELLRELENTRRRF